MSADGVVQIFRRVLETDDIHADSNFFLFGGDSLLATRVVSRKPVAHNAACAFGCDGSRTLCANVAATTCGRWLERQTSASCVSGESRSKRPPTAFQKASTFRNAARFVRRVGVTTHIAPSNKSARAAATPVLSAPAIG